MKSRRKNQPPMDSLPLLARFLSHASIQEDVPQSHIAKELGTSTASVSRWFHGSASPTDKELQQIAKIYKIPVENFYALRVLDSMGPKKPTLATAAGFHFMASYKKANIFMSGMTMLGGIIQLRIMDFKDKNLFVNIIDPTSDDAINYERNMYGLETGSLPLSWLNSISILQSKFRENNCNIKLWIRNELRVLKSSRIGELVSNDWIALVSSLPHKTATPSVHFYGDSYWNSIVAPLMLKMKSNDDFDETVLMWQSMDRKDAKKNSRYLYLVNSVLKNLQVKNIAG